MIELRNKIEQGYHPEKKDLENFNDRSTFIVDNMKLLKLNPQETTQHLTFLAKMTKLLNEEIKNELENKADN